VRMGYNTGVFFMKIKINFFYLIFFLLFPFRLYAADVISATLVTAGSSTAATATTSTVYSTGNSSAGFSSGSTALQSCENFIPMYSSWYNSTNAYYSFTYSSYSYNQTSCYIYGVYTSKSNGSTSSSGSTFATTNSQKTTYSCSTGNLNTTTNQCVVDPVYSCPSGYSHSTSSGAAGSSSDAYCVNDNPCDVKSGQSVTAYVSYSSAPTQICVSQCLATRKVSVSFGNTASSTILWQSMTYKYTGASCTGNSSTTGQEFVTEDVATAANTSAQTAANYQNAVTQCGGADNVSAGTVNGSTTYTCKSTDSTSSTASISTSTTDNSDGSTTTTATSTTTNSTTSTGGGSGYSSGSGTTTTTTTTTNPTTGESATSTTTETTGSGSGTGITANYDTTLNDWDSKNFGTVMESHVESLKATPIYTGLVSFTDVSISGSCSPIEFSVMDMSASFDICSALDSFLSIVSAVVIFLASWIAFRIVQE